MQTTRRELLYAGAIAGGLCLKNQIYAQSNQSDKHVVLLGDSIFDNKIYVGTSPAVIDQVRSTLGNQWKATLLAVDGNVTNDVVRQMQKLPETATHLVISVGGNDALVNQAILTGQDSSAAATFLKLSEIQQMFGTRYETMIKQVLSQNRPTAVYTIYDPNFANSQQNQIASAALSVFNDRITRTAFAHGIPVIDLRLLFTGKQDYANPIEPSPQGGAKIAKQIQQILLHHDFTRKQSVIYPAAK